ncbi:MAG TPA: D-alanyl-D-alanine carboxypeptidase/D-alanyl-D-alanine-endopeptidase, partial [Amaricoccus sp.]|nr:D-alanyl-D-alanine carboxypeptidase/D-alanyl-D-alanine-endopeptidase [Amaricoccus sp.]
MTTTRRSLIAGAASLVASHALGLPALAEVARPRPRPAAGGTAGTLDAIFARSGLRAATGFALVDLETGTLLEAMAPDAPRPPASVQKLVTALYAQRSLGPDYRFATRLLASGPLVKGRLAGDLVLAGGGDPVLDTDGLAALAATLRIAGVAAVEGRFLVADGALPAAEAIDGEQPADAAYDPGVAGINLNFNRVFASWKPGGAGLGFRAPGERQSVEVAGIRGAPTEAALPSRRVTAAGEVWALPRAGMRRAGSLWLPVAQPARYAGEVFRGLAGRQGLGLPPAEVVATAPAGGLLAIAPSPPLATILRDMLRFSTNLTAEVVGLRASQARGLAPADLAQSAAAMTEWAAGLGLEPAQFLNHSGLSGAARVSPAALVRFLAAAEATSLPELMPVRPIVDDDGDPAPGGVTLRAKTG